MEIIFIFVFYRCCERKLKIREMVLKILRGFCIVLDFDMLWRLSVFGYLIIVIFSFIIEKVGKKS